MSYEQLPLTLEEESAIDDATEGGIAQAAQALDSDAGRQWAAWVFELWHHVALRQQFLTTDDIWALMGPDEGGNQFRSQMGPVVRRVVRAKLIEKTSEFVQSRRPARHRNGLRVWRSLVYTGTAPLPLIVNADLVEP